MGEFGISSTLHTLLQLSVRHHTPSCQSCPQDQEPFHTTPHKILPPSPAHLHSNNQPPDKLLRPNAGQSASNEVPESTESAAAPQQVRLPPHSSTPYYLHLTGGMYSILPGGDCVPATTQ